MRRERAKLKCPSLVMAVLAATARWMARWTGQHPPIIPIPQKERDR